MRKVIIMFALAMGIITANAQENVTVETTNGCLLYTSTLSDAEDLPGKVATDTRYEKLSTDRSDCRLSRCV